MLTFRLIQSKEKISPPPEEEASEVEYPDFWENATGTIRIDALGIGSPKSVASSTHGPPENCHLNVNIQMTIFRKVRSTPALMGQSEQFWAEWRSVWPQIRQIQSRFSIFGLPSQNVLILI